MRVVFSCSWSNAPEWLARLQALAPEFTFVPAERLDDPASIEAAVVWRPPADLFERLPNLRWIFVLGAGVDDLLTSPEMRLPDVPIVRTVDPVMTERMATYVLAAILYWQRDLHDYAAHQREGRWAQHGNREPAEVTVGIMGLGAMGRAAADLLRRVGYDVAGWSRSPKDVAGVACFAGEDGLAAFLARTEFLVCLLPLTGATRGILGARTFAALPDHAVIINAGRGGHVVEADLLAALDAGRLRGAVLDVFATEPLPARHPFWRHPRILVTPHVASLSHPDTGAALAVEALRIVRAGGTPPHVVDRARGY